MFHVLMMGIRGTKKLNPYKKLDLRDDSLKIEDYINLKTKKAVSRFIFDSKTTINIVNENLFEICLQGSKKFTLKLLKESPA